MEDEYDIYGDLEGFEADAAQDNKVVHELNAQIAELRAKIAEKETEKQDTLARNTILLENISSLLVTAKAELRRKDAVIADIRRERDNTAFRRGGTTRAVQKHDQGTQTTLIRLLDREVQTCSVGTEKVEESRIVKRERGWEDYRREEVRQRERLRIKERVSVKDRLGGRLLGRHEVKSVHGARRGRGHEEERERERQARRGPRSPDADRMRSGVRFRSPVRVKTEDSSVPDSASDVELSRAFIPMNRKELDRYVKEIGRDQNRSPVVVEVTKREKTSKTLKDVSKSELWDTSLRKKSKTPKKLRKLGRKTPVKQKSPSIIQSDEIGTTAGSHSSPVKSEDIEQRMSVLHGQPPLPEPPMVVIPPPEPPIVEHVPEVPVDDDAKLNDSRELKIIESSDEQIAQGELMVEDEPNSSAETVIERSLLEDEDLEDGEIITPAPSPAPPPPLKVDVAEEKRNAKIAKALAQLAEETRVKMEQEDIKHNIEVQESSKPTPGKPKCKRTEIELPPLPSPVEAPPPPKDPTPERTKHKRNLNGAFDSGATNSRRRNSHSDGASAKVDGEKVKRKQRLSDPARKTVVIEEPKKKTETLQALFGSDDEGSFAGWPEAELALAGKRKRTQSEGESVRSKKSRTENNSNPEVENETVSNEEKKVLENEAVLSNENKAVPENESLPCDENEQVPNDEGEVVPENEQVSTEAVLNPDGDDSKKEQDNDAQKEQRNSQEIESNEADKQEPEPMVEEPAATSHPHEQIVVSNKYCEYRIEDDNEAETTFFVTRKKKKKSKSKSKNASLNASGTV